MRKEAIEEFYRLWDAPVAPPWRRRSRTWPEDVPVDQQRLCALAHLLPIQRLPELLEMSKATGLDVAPVVDVVSLRMQWLGLDDPLWRNINALQFGLLLGRLPASFVSRLMHVAATQFPETLPTLLSALGTSTPQETLRDALGIVARITRVELRAKALEALLASISGAMTADALRIVGTIPPELRRETLFELLAPRLSEVDWPDACGLARQLPVHDSRVKALLALVRARGDGVPRDVLLDLIASATADSRTASSVADAICDLVPAELAEPLIEMAAKASIRDFYTGGWDKRFSAIVSKITVRFPDLLDERLALLTRRAEVSAQQNALLDLLPRLPAPARSAAVTELLAALPKDTGRSHRLLSAWLGSTSTTCLAAEDRRRLQQQRDHVAGKLELDWAMTARRLQAADPSGEYSIGIEQMERTLKAARAEEPAEAKGEALLGCIQLAPQEQKALLAGEAFAAFRAVAAPWARFHGLIRVATQLPLEERAAAWNEAMSAMEKIESSAVQAYARRLAGGGTDGPAIKALLRGSVKYIESRTAKQAWDMTSEEARLALERATLADGDARRDILSNVLTAIEMRSQCGPGWAQLLETVIPLLPDGLYPRALEVYFALQPQPGEAILGLARHMPDSLIRTEIGRLPKGYSFEPALKILIGRLPANERIGVARCALRHVDPARQVRIYEALAYAFSAQERFLFRTEARSVSLAIPDVKARVASLVLLAESANGEERKSLIEEALDAARQVAGPESQARALLQVAAILPQARNSRLLAEVIGAAQRIPDPVDRAMIRTSVNAARGPAPTADADAVLAQIQALLARLPAEIGQALLLKSFERMLGSWKRHLESKIRLM